jgi:hypothetical protein
MMIPPDVSTLAKTRAAFAASTRAGFGPHSNQCSGGSYRARHLEAWCAIEERIRRLSVNEEIEHVAFPVAIRVETGETFLESTPWVKVRVPGRGWRVIGTVRDFAR